MPVPVTVIVQLDVGDAPPIELKARVVPWLMASSNPSLSAVISAKPAVTLAFAWYLKYAGIANVAKIPMIATTINNSIKEKPF